MRCWCSRRLASSRSTLSRTVTSVLVGHQLGDRLARVAGEAHVAVGQDADQPLPPRSTTGMPEIR